MNSTLPPAITKHLWDADLGQVDTQQHAPFIISRILEYGDFDSLRAIKQIYPNQVIVQALQNSRTISAKVAKYFADYFSVDYQSVRGLREPFLQKQYRFG
jgi:hypothetical protein